MSYATAQCHRPLPNAIHYCPMPYATAQCHTPLPNAIGHCPMSYATAQCHRPLPNVIRHCPMPTTTAQCHTPLVRGHLRLDNISMVGSLTLAETSNVTAAMSSSALS